MRSTRARANIIAPHSDMYRHTLSEHFLLFF